MKKFFCITPLQPEGKLDRSRYEAVDNPRLQYDHDTRFPLCTLLNAYAEKGEKVEIITVALDHKNARHNAEYLREEVKELSGEKGFLCDGVKEIEVPYSSSVKDQVSVFRKLLDYIDDDDCLYACLTYGTKPITMALLLALQYAYRAKKNVYIDSLVYGEKDHDAGKMKVYDMTALVQIQQIALKLADIGVQDPKKMLDHIIEE